MDEDDNSNKTTQTTVYPDGGADSRPALTIDYAKYERYLENADLTEGQKRDFIEALWTIIVSFVDLGFGVHPLQQACEQKPVSVEELITGTADMVELKNNPKSEFEAATERTGVPSQGPEVI